MSTDNPYQSPQAPTPLPQPPGELFAPCPKCGGRSAKRISFTFWGGAIGPRLFNHVKCFACGTTYNGKTGRSNATAIAIYTIVCGVIAVAFVIAMRSMQR
jgi:hypothetical protein